jgi:hypothetical protein
MWVEQRLDELGWSATERMRHRAQGAVLAVEFVGRVRQRVVQKLEAPQWMEPPDDASYLMSARRYEKTPVDLDPDAAACLDQALSSATLRAGGRYAQVTVWFDSQSDAGANGVVAVHLGQRTVGVLNRQASERLAPHLAAAAKRGVKPRAPAELAKATHLRPPYLLVVAVPLPDSPS